MAIEEQLLNEVRGLGQRIDVLESLLRDALAKPEMAVKEAYTVNQAALRTKAAGVRSYAAWTIRHACNSGRIPEARRGENGHWVIPHDALERILTEGLPAGA